MAYRLRIWELNGDNTISLTDHFFENESEPAAYAEANGIEHYEARDGNWQLLAEKDTDSIRFDSQGQHRQFDGPVKVGN